MTVQKLKILSFSDIHSDVNKVGYREDGDEWVKFSDRFNEILHQYKDIDIVACAGDVSPSTLELQHTLELINESIDAQYYVFVPGNYDVWELEYMIYSGITLEKYEVILRKATEKAMTNTCGCKVSEPNQRPPKKPNTSLRAISRTPMDSLSVVVALCASPEASAPISFTPKVA